MNFIKCCFMVVDQKKKDRYVKLKRSAIFIDEMETNEHIDVN